MTAALSPSLPALLSAACVAAVAGLLWTEHRGQHRWRAPLKLAASSCFVALAWALGALQSAYGQWLLAALLLGWVGDALLLSERSGWFMAGLLSFLLSHGAFAAAFAVGGLAAQGVLAALPPAAATAWAVWRWLGPRLQGALRLAVPVYVAAILVMCCAAAGHAAARGAWLALAGALLFALSDLAVARERFVARGFANKLWGWPTYFSAQLLLAWTLATPPGA